MLVDCGGGFGRFEVFFDLEHGIGFERFLNLLLKIEGRQLQQPNGLLQLRGHRQLLAHLELER